MHLHPLSLILDLRSHVQEISQHPGHHVPQEVLTQLDHEAKKLAHARMGSPPQAAPHCRTSLASSGLPAGLVDVN